ncbi:helix-turn-helix domain-containing protein [Filomicrobium insigne]|uniref:helix-turn-helix domain-containing protein n=1 Tax=Filomicrobium insigne TaxID=418854 RepID=UPI000B7CFE6B|nr:helix-turn-helix domain-containing protein [Filomicrobium insigne]
MTDTHRPPIRVKAIIASVSSEFGVTPQEIVGPRQNRNLIAARCAVACLARRAGRSLPQIGRVLNRHHATILNAERRAAQRMTVDPEFRRCVETIDRRLGCRPIFASETQEDAHP